MTDDERFEWTDESVEAAQVEARRELRERCGAALAEAERLLLRGDGGRCPACGSERVNPRECDECRHFYAVNYARFAFLERVTDREPPA